MVLRENREKGLQRTTKALPSEWTKDIRNVVSQKVLSFLNFLHCRCHTDLPSYLAAVVPEIAVVRAPRPLLVTEAQCIKAKDSTHTVTH